MHLIRLLEIRGHFGQKLIGANPYVDCESKFGMDLVLKFCGHIYRVFLIESESHVDEALIDGKLLKYGGVGAAYFHKAFGKLPVPLPISRDNDKFRAGPQCHAYWLGCFYSEFLGRKGSRCHDTSAIGRVSGYNRRDEPDIRPALRQYLNCRPTQKSRVDIYVENYPFERHKTICTRPSS